jgi:hypothetical protein
MRRPSTRSVGIDLRGTPRSWAVPLHAGRVTHCVRVTHHTALEAQLGAVRRLRKTGTLGLFRKVGTAVRTTKQVLA